MGNELTEGQYRVGVTFNPSNNTDVDWIKETLAGLIDMMQDIVQSQSGINPGAARCAAIAATSLEEAAMWAVKAVTKPTR